MAEWAPSFATVRGPVPLEDFVLFGDCYYLPHEEGPEAEALYRAAAGMLHDPADPGAAKIFRERASRLQAFCAALTELRHRPLFHALSRRAWELREQLDLPRSVGAGWLRGWSSWPPSGCHVARMPKP